MAETEAGYFVTWGNSLIVSPWGEVIARADSSETIIYADIGNLLSVFHDHYRYTTLYWFDDLQIWITYNKYASKFH